MVKYGNYKNLDFFNPSPCTVVHVDLNSCFASVEQQANPLLRGKPIAVAAYDSPGGCIIAPSVEAKELGIKVGMRVKDARAVCPGLFVIEPDPPKYRDVHLKLKKIISSYTNDFSPKSIDEFNLDLAGYPALLKSTPAGVCTQIKERIKKEVGDWLRVSIGISTNRFLAKTAASLHKPDGLDEINSYNFKSIYSKLSLTDLCGIKERNALRLRVMGINSVLDFYKASFWKLKSAFQSINSYYWFLRLRGYEIDNFKSDRKSFGNSYALPKPFKNEKDLGPVLFKLCEKMGYRLRRFGFAARGVHMAVSYRSGAFWHRGVTFDKLIFDSRDIYKGALFILKKSPLKLPVSTLFVSCFYLVKRDFLQLDLFEDNLKKERLVNSIDKINSKWGDFVIGSAKLSKADKRSVPDRIAFGGVKELEEYVNF